MRKYVYWSQGGSKTVCNRGVHGVEVFFFQAEDGIRDLVRSRGLGDVYKRQFLDRVATHIMAFEGDSKVVWYEGNYSEYEADRKKRLGKEADQPHRIRYRKLTRN